MDDNLPNDGAKQAGESLATPHVLLVDDNERNLFVMKKIVKRLGVDISMAQSGAEALALANEHQFALIYLDVQMPEMDGFETARRLRLQGEDAPLVFVTALNQDEDYVKIGYDAGAIDYLFKPINPHVLEAKTRVFIKLYEQQESLKRNAQHFEHLVNFDTLTKLPNRTHFNMTAAKTIATADRYNRTCALLMLDLDDFKHVNDTFGHDVGDELLIEVARRMTDALREGDYAFRLGGDEFSILLPELEQATDAGRVAQRVLDKVGAPLKISNYDIKSTPSIGIACFPFAGKDLETLFKHADVALYQAKKHGKNGFQYFTDMLNESYSNNMTMEHELQQALDRNEFYLVYQPRFSLQTGKLTGVEILTRWKNERLGEISPAQFIPAAESGGMIVPLGKWIIERATSQIKVWLPDLDPEAKLRFSINLSLRQMKDKSFGKMVLDTLTEYQVPTRYVEFEVKETELLSGVDFLEDTFRPLYKEGVTFALDDFGTGYSSLKALKELPIESLKIDNSFVQALSEEGSAGDPSIILSILALANALNLSCVAEGIETEDQMKILKEAGCSEGQGYLLSRPVDNEAMRDILQKHCGLGGGA